MRLWASLLSYLLALFTTPVLAADAPKQSTQNAFDFTFIGIDGEPLPLSQYRGRAVLIVNVASKCGFVPQYAEMQTLWETYRNKGLVVIAVPANDFDNQEPGAEADIKKFATEQYNVTFPMTSKVHVIGDEAHPFYRWAVAQLGTKARPVWNFHKYLIAPDGRLADWFFSFTSATSPRVVRSIEANLPKDFVAMPEPPEPGARPKK
ncbi:MAG: glutathione peroxidase [Alphaproteobacteria bacterium]|nr:glutathione peroxidase [Alphaproteobacteria bacterium]